jgi:hypothetical protein
VEIEPPHQAFTERLFLTQNSIASNINRPALAPIPHQYSEFHA